MNYYLPYKIDINTEDQFYSKLEDLSKIIFEKGQIELQQIINNRQDISVTSENEVKLALIELLLIGVLWQNHSYNALATNAAAFSELEHFRMLAEMIQTGNLYKSIYHKMQTDLLVHQTKPIFISQKPDEKSFQKLIHWLNATGEYKYELPILENWFSHWNLTGRLSVDFEKITEFTNYFIKIGEKTIGSAMNPIFFNVIRDSIHGDRDDYFQITKSESEYFLNFLAAAWLNEINESRFQSIPEKLVFAPGCMRPGNGKNCKAISEGEYLKCTSCNENCNIKKLADEIQSLNYELRIALHQSAFKADESFLENKAVIGVACAGCLLSGGLMLRQKGITAKCLVLNKPGCKKHWSNLGEATSISYLQLEKLLPVYAPITCTTSDS